MLLNPRLYSRRGGGVSVSPAVGFWTSLLTTDPMAFCCSSFLLFVAVATLSAFVSADAVNSIDGCGGFVEASSSLVTAWKPSKSKFDYSHITVELQTNDGLVKDRTQCAPNGYYFIPVYDRGSFVVKVKGPDGWSWSPESVPVIIDQNGCNSNADINFRFTGFAISGKVKGAVGGESCLVKDGGPSNINVELLSPSGDLVSSVLTSELGLYSFTNILPGKYQLHASHPNIEIYLKGSTEVELGFGNLIVDDTFFVSGYNVRGFVAAQGNPILGVHIYLYSDDVLDMNCPLDHGNAPGRNNSLCHAVTDADGKFLFTKVPCGVYELLPYYKGENTIFDVSPSSLVVSVEHHDVMIDQTFQVTGFSVGGRVISDGGLGINDVTIMVDGHVRAVTDDQGYYKLDQVTSKHYFIQAKKEHYKFKALENFLVLPNMASIADIEAVAYDLCGSVHSITADQKAKVALTHGSDSIRQQLKETDYDGKFCFEVLAGEYRLSAVAVKTENSFGVVFSPPHIDVMVKGPVLDVEFFQAQVNIHGTVQCKDRCSSLVSISLERLLSKSTEEIKTIYLHHGNDSFVFHSVFPGKYQLKVKRSSFPAISDDDWCWNENALDIDVGTEDKKGIVFVQKGYWIDITSTHDVHVSILHPDSSYMNLQIKKGPQRICIESAGLHELQFLDSCISFGSSSVKFDTLNPLPMHLRGEKYLLKGEIHIPSDVLPDPFDMSNHLVIDILNEDHAVVATTKATFIDSENTYGNTSVYEYSAWAGIGERLKFVPRDTRISEERKILFYPNIRQVAVTKDGCQDKVASILGRTGLYLEGSVSPAVSEVSIRILAEGHSPNAPLQKGELALEVETGADGLFIAGPLYDDTTYHVEASKAGYHLKALGLNSFSCQKLGQINVHIYGGEIEESFPPVFLSLSGDDGYRNNTVTVAGGKFNFSDLFPGSFFLRPLLKEYSFSPPAQAIELGPGESKELVFSATRVAYSIFGRVSLLSGVPRGVHLEARSESKGYYEETTTDSLGNYRLRGLLPHTTYLIRVVEKKDIGTLEIERSSPESVVVEVGTEDIRSLDFVVFEQPEITILSGYVEGIRLEELQAHLSVEIRSASDSSKIETIVPLPLSYYFEVRDLPRGKHLVQLVSHFPSATHKLQSEVLEVNLDEKPQLHIGALRYDIEEYHQKQDITPAPVFPLVVGIAVIALFVSIPRLKELYQVAVGSAAFGSVAVTGRKEGRKPILRKRAF